MQLYHGLPVITNKITLEEMKGIPHHLLGCIGLGQETWTVGKFVGEALSTVGMKRERYLIEFTDITRSSKSGVEASYPFW